jgi:ferredoxin
VRVEIDPRLCIGSTNCVEEAPDAFEMDERGVARLRTPPAPDTHVTIGAHACPVGAIRLYDPVTGRQIHP